MSISNSQMNDSAFLDVSQHSENWNLPFPNGRFRILGYLLAFWIWGPHSRHANAQQTRPGNAFQKSQNAILQRRMRQSATRMPKSHARMRETNSGMSVCERRMPQRIAGMLEFARPECRFAIPECENPILECRFANAECQFANAECENALQEFGHSHVPNADLIFRMPKGIRECEICHWRMANPSSQNADWRLRMRNRSFWELCGMVHLATSTSSRSQNPSASTSTCCWCLDTTNFPASNPHVPHYDGYSLIARVPYLVL